MTPFTKKQNLRSRILHVTHHLRSLRPYPTRHLIRLIPPTSNSTEREEKSHTDDRSTPMTSSSSPPMETIRGLDINRYMGRWYEIASFPSRNQPKDGRETRATYTLNPDGTTIHVLNETWSSGKRGYIEGTAYKVDPNSDEAKLKVKFYVPPFLPVFPVTGDYWVLHLDQDYQFALVGQPSRRCLWILCRKPQMDEEVYKMLVQKAIDAGYDVKDLHITQHSDTPPEADQGPNDNKGVWWIKSVLGK